MSFWVMIRIFLGDILWLVRRLFEHIFPVSIEKITRRLFLKELRLDHFFDASCGIRLGCIFCSFPSARKLLDEFFYLFGGNIEGSEVPVKFSVKVASCSIFFR